MSREIHRVEGETRYIPLEFTGITLSAAFTTIEMQIEREGFALVTLTRVVDDDANGQCHFEPQAAHITPGTHKARFRTVDVGTGVVKFYPNLADDPIYLVVSRALQDQA